MSLHALFSSVQNLLSLCFFSLTCAKYCISYANLPSLCSAELQWQSIQPDAASAEMSDKMFTGNKMGLITALLLV